MSGGTNEPRYPQKVSHMVQIPDEEYIEYVTIPDLFSKKSSMFNRLAKFFKDDVGMGQKAHVLLEVNSILNNSQLTPEVLGNVIEKLLSVVPDRENEQCLMRWVSIVRDSFNIVYNAGYSSVVEEFKDSLLSSLSSLAEDVLNNVVRMFDDYFHNEFARIVDQDIENGTARSIEIYAKYLKLLRQFVEGKEVSVDKLSEALKVIGVESPNEIAELLMTFRPKLVIEFMSDRLRDMHGYLGILIRELGYNIC